MRDVEIRHVDERDVTSEVTPGRYRIYLYNRDRAEVGLSVSAFDVAGRDVESVIRIAEGLRDESSAYSIAALVDLPDEVLAVWLVGRDPSELNA